METLQPFHPSPEKIEQMMAAQNRVPVQFYLYTGNAGNGKSEMMARHIMAWFAWTELRGTYEDCYSNLYVKTPDWWPGKPRETKLLELSDLAYSIQQEIEDQAKAGVNVDPDDEVISSGVEDELEKMSDCMIAIDEGQNWADRQNWQSVKSRLFNYILMQRRHLHFHIAMTIQNRIWLNRRTDYQVDFEIGCQSMHKFEHNEDFAEWERLPGQYIWCTIRDLSGLIRIKSWYEDHFEKTMRVGPMWPFWECYSTSQNQDVFEPFRKMQIQTKKQNLNIDKQRNQVGDSSVREYSDPYFAENVCDSVLGECIYSNKLVITGSELLEMCRAKGLSTDQAYIGRILANRGAVCTRKRFNGGDKERVYDLEPLLNGVEAPV